MPDITNQLLRPQCQHPYGQGTVLVSVGNALRQDDGVGRAVLDDLAARQSLPYCRFDIGCYTSQLVDCLKGHKVGVVLDATKMNNHPGNTVVIDLNEAIKKRQDLNVSSCHGFSLFDELQLARWQGKLPDKLYFFGIEANNTDWSEGLSAALQKQLPQITNNLATLLQSITDKN